MDDHLVMTSSSVFRKTGKNCGSRLPFEHLWQSLRVVRSQEVTISLTKNYRVTCGGQIGSRSLWHTGTQLHPIRLEADPNIVGKGTYIGFDLTKNPNVSLVLVTDHVYRTLLELQEGA
ncbi:hypothetical protein B5X24_HaOG216498 [Helicoverpa armigera]|nr:hypothetical protein B5X24_HaOG216498 [Helicoverpa armigera]